MKNILLKKEDRGEGRLYSSETCHSCKRQRGPWKLPRVKEISGRVNKQMLK